MEARDILDYALVLLEPPPPEEEAFALMGAGGVAGASFSSINSNDPAAATAADAECQVGRLLSCAMIRVAHLLLVFSCVVLSPSSSSSSRHERQSFIDDIWGGQWWWWLLGRLCQYLVIPTSDVIRSVKYLSF